MIWFKWTLVWWMAWIAQTICWSQPPNSENNLVVMTFNIRFDNPGDGVNRWELRKEKVAQTMKFHGAAIGGLQEALQHQIEDLKALLPGWESVGVGRDDGKSAGEFSPIFYDTARIKLLEHQTFWLSNSPDTPSRGWDAALPRIATWAKFRDKTTDRVFFVFNTHFDHIGQVARRESALLLIRQVEAIAANYPALLMGDFNATPADEPIKLLSQHFSDGKIISLTPHFGPDSTYNGFSNSEKEGMQIDFIFLHGQSWKVLRHATVSQTWGGRFASDHHPVMAELAWQSETINQKE